MSKINGIYAAGLSVLDDNLALDVKKTIKHERLQQFKNKTIVR